MIELFENDMKMQNRQSSKGNQMKWIKDGIWFKADYTGYEGLAEYVVSSLLKTSTLKDNSYEVYQTEKIRYKYVEYLGCSSKNFLPKGWQMITLERLFQNAFGHSLNKSIYSINDVTERIRFLVNQIIRITGLHEFGTYLCNLLTVDTLFLNEDRHTHNIAVLIDSNGQYQYCPIFDNGGCLLSDTTIDYPMTVETELLMQSVESKTFDRSFDEQLDAAEKLYGQNLKFSFDINHVEELLSEEKNYPDETKKRVEYILLAQRRKYQYLFK